MKCSGAVIVYRISFIVSSVYVVSRYAQAPFSNTNNKMRKDLATLLTTALTKFIDENGSVGRCMSNEECVSLEKAFVCDNFHDIYAFAKKKLMPKNPIQSAFDLELHKALDWANALDRDEWVGEFSKRLLTIAHEQFEKEEAEHLKDVRDFAYNKGVADTKKTIPMWLIDEDYDEKTHGNDFSLHPVGIAYRGYYIPYLDLLKLPKEKKDESGTTA